MLILACGTSYYAGLTAKYWLESIARIPVEVEIASEYRYRDSVPHENRLVVTISQRRGNSGYAGGVAACPGTGNGWFPDDLQCRDQCDGA